MLTKALLWLTGIHSTSFLSKLPNLLFVITITLISACLHHFKKIKGFHFLTIFLLGLSWATWNAKANLGWTLPNSLENKPVLAKGYVVSIPEKVDQKIKFYFKLTQLADMPTQAKIQLTWHHCAESIYVGEHKQLLIKLKRPHSILNPGGFDQEKFYFKEKIRAIGYVLKSPQNQSLTGYSFFQIPDFFRQWLYEKMALMVSPNNFMGIVIALCLGIKNYITPEQWSIFQATGTSHLVAISGLHIGLAAGFFYFFTQQIWKRFVYLTHLLPVQQAGATSGLVGGFFYSALAGFSIPTQRALIMISILMLAVLYRRNVGAWHGFALTVFFSLLIDPLASLSESFWLSFGAVFFIFYTNANRISFSKNLWDRISKIQWAVTLGLFPITLLFFQQTSLVTLPANFIAIPWFSFIVIPLALLGMILTPVSEVAAQWILLFSNQLIEWIFIPVHYLSQLSFSQWHVSLQNHWLFGFILSGIFLLLAPKGIPAKWLGILTFIPLYFFPQPLASEKKVIFTLLDVGQGLSAIIRTQNHTLVFDTGARFSDRFDMGKAVILPYLRHEGIQMIDTLIVSHKDNDHMGGAHTILKHFPVRQILTSTPEYFPAKSAEFCYRGQHWIWDGVEFEILYPLWGKPYEGNNSSCTLRIKTGKHAILITGDLEKKGEAELLKLERNRLASTLLIAGHHGSRTSSTWPFISQVKPQYALFSAGYLNPYKFPHPLIVHRYKLQGSLRENTADSGGLYFEIDPQHGVIKKIRYREMLKKYWHHSNHLGK